MVIIKTEEVLLDGEKVNVVIEIDKDLIEESLEDEDLEKTLDLSKTMEIVSEEL